MKPIHEKHHRLPAECYRGRVVVAFTLCLKDRITALTKPPIFNVLEKILMEELRRGKCEVHVYLMMPDHCHLLLEGADDNSNLLDVMKRFKQRTGYWFSQSGSGLLWQKDFYDHVLRNDDDVRKHIEYILQNPVRKELTQDWLEYQFKGSSLYDFSEW